MKTHTTSLKAKFNSAFSLVELLVVIAVIAVIAAIAIPNITGVREAATGAQQKYNLESLSNTFNQISALGLTNSSGAAATLTDVSNGTSFSGLINGSNVVMKWQP